MKSWLVKFLRLDVPVSRQRLTRGGKLFQEVMEAMGTSSVTSISQLLDVEAGQGQETSLELLLSVRSIPVVKALETVKRDGHALGNLEELPALEHKWATDGTMAMAMLMMRRQRWR